MKKIFKKLVYSNNLFFCLYYNYLYKPKDMLQGFLNQYSKSKSVNNNLTFIQIGANDGFINDPIYKFIRRDNWKGILIEPQEDAFQRLKENYKNFSSLKFENVAIDKDKGTKKFYKIGFTNARWAAGLSSFLRDNIEIMIEAGYIQRKASEDNISLPDDKDSWIIEVDIKTDTIKNIIKKHNIIKLDLIIIDAERYDYEIIKTIPFDLIKPEVIIYEHIGLDENTKIECKSFLSSLGYNFKIANSDTIAYLT